MKEEKLTLLSDSLAANLRFLETSSIEAKSDLLELSLGSFSMYESLDLDLIFIDIYNLFLSVIYRSNKL